MIKLNFDLEFKDLYTFNGIRKLDNTWINFLKENQPNLYQQCLTYELNDVISDDQYSRLILELAPFLEDFIALLFHIDNEIRVISQEYSQYAIVYRCKRQFIQREVLKNAQQGEYYDINVVRAKLSVVNVDPLDELKFAEFVFDSKLDNDVESIQIASNYSLWACLTPEGKARHKHGILFQFPKKIDPVNLLHDAVKQDEIWHSTLPSERDSFSSHSKMNSKIKAFDQSNYCIHCHFQSKDSCSKGMKSENGFKINDSLISLTGCPLEEKISEMNLLKSQGSIVGALAVAMIDNPMLAATGHRICNDCMKSCIFQKQEPVDVPLIETQTLDDVLSLSWGFEIYNLLTKWNPLKLSENVLKDFNGYNVLIAGLGPAGFTMAHYLTNLGYNVTAIDMLKIESKYKKLSEFDSLGNPKFAPIKNVKDELFEDLANRVPQGFGGVSEYGITVRWNKNYLSIIRLILERRWNFRMYGGVRFGSNIDYNIAKDLKFDHIVFAMGAGKPNLPDVHNILAKGCRLASDFLMTLQQSGAFLPNSLVNMQIRLPIVVIGGGLTAIDTATEALMYYYIQVEKFLIQYEALGNSIFEKLNDEEIVIANEFISHATNLRKCVNAQEKLDLMNNWGGVKVLYRKSIYDSPAYRLNHEEVCFALNEGIKFIENIIPKEVILDEFSSTHALMHESGIILAKTILIATGTSPNISIANEDNIHFMLNGKYFQAYDSEGLTTNCEVGYKKSKNIDVILNNGRIGPSVSYLGDLHPAFAGSVVKAMASAKKGYPIIDKLIREKSPKSNINGAEFNKFIAQNLKSTVQKIVFHNDHIQEIIVNAPLAAKNFKPGQFYKFQTYNKNDSTIMEPLALTGAWVDKSKNLISLIVLNLGASSNFCKQLEIGEPVVLMGPTGTSTEIPFDKTVMLVGGGLGNAVLFSIGKALKENKCKVIYFAGYKNARDRFKQTEIEKISDVVVWCCDEEILSRTRNLDYSFKGNVIDCIHQYNDAHKASLKLYDVEHMIVIGSSAMMSAVAYARHNELKAMFRNDHIAIGSINSPMQCMSKEICGQCIQRHINPKTNQEYYVYSCSNQDQLLDEVDFNHLQCRLAQNSLQEKITNLLSGKIIADINN